MSSNMTTLLKQAAEMRASGHSWEQIGKKLHRKGKTCKGWPQVYASEWQPIYREIQLHRFDQMAQECRDRLHALCRNEDIKVQQRALEFVSRHGAQAYGANGSITPPAPPGPPPPPPAAEAKPASPHETIWEAAKADMDEMWAWLNKDRAKQGLPPATEQEFYADYMGRKAEEDRIHALPLFLDANGNSIDPPEGDGPGAPEDGTSTLPK